jgi:hypothetical protein
VNEALRKAWVALRCEVEYDVRVLAGKNGPQASRIADIQAMVDYRSEFGAETRGTINANQPGRAETIDGSEENLADAAGAAGYEDFAACNQIGNLSLVKVYLTVTHVPEGIIGEFTH